MFNKEHQIIASETQEDILRPDFSFRSVQNPTHSCRCEGDLPEAIPNFTGDCFAAKNAARNDIEIYVFELGHSLSFLCIPKDSFGHIINYLIQH